MLYEELSNRGSSSETLLVHGSLGAQRVGLRVANEAGGCPAFAIHSAAASLGPNTDRAGCHLNSNDKNWISIKMI